MNKTILTGLRVNSVLTLGNYLGALLPTVRLANKFSKDYTVNIFVPDLHSIISSVDGTLKDNTIRSIKYFLWMKLCCPLGIAGSSVRNTSMIMVNHIKRK